MSCRKWEKIGSSHLSWANSSSHRNWRDLIGLDWSRVQIRWLCKPLLFLKSMCDFRDSIASVESSASPRGEKDSVYVCGRFFYKKQRGEANSVIYGIIRFNYNSNCYNLEHRSSSLAIRSLANLRERTVSERTIFTGDQVSQKFKLLCI